MSEEYTTTAVLKASVGDFVAGMVEAKNSYKSLQSTLANTNTSSLEALGNSSNVVSKTIKRAMAVGTTALVGMAGAAIKTGSDFEHQMSRVAAISDATGKDFSGLKKEAIDLGAKTQFSAKQAAEGMENLASAGLKPKEIMSAMPGVLNLAAVSGGNVAEAADDAAVAMNGFGLEASKSGHVADVFARAAADTNAEAQDMGQALKMVAPQAHAAGLSLEETAAAIGILSNAGIKGSEAGSNLAMALTKVQNPSEEAKKAMQQIGFSAYDSSGKMKPLAQQVEELRGKLSGMTDQQKQYYMSEMYGVQGGRAMNVLLSSQSGEFEKLTKSLQNSDGAAEKMAKRMQQDLASSIEQFGGALESLGITVEGVFDGDLRKGVDAASGAVDKFTKYIQANQGEIQKEVHHIENMAKALLGMLPSVHQVVGALKAVLPAFLAIEGFKGIGVGAAKTVKALQTMQADLSLVSRGVTVASSGFGKFAKVANSLSLTPFRKTVEGTTKSVFNFGKSLGDGSAFNKFQDNSTIVGKAYIGISNQSKKTAQIMGDSIKSAASVVGKYTKEMYGAIRHPIESIQDLTNATYAQFDKIAAKIGSTSKSMAKSMEDLHVSIDNAMVKSVNKVGDFGKASANAFSELANKSKQMGQAVANNIKAMADKTSQYSSNVYQSLRHPIKGTNEVTGAFTKMNELSSAALGKLKEQVTAFNTLISNKGKQAGQAIVNSVKATSGQVAQYSNVMYQSLRHPIKGTDEVTGAFTKMKNGVVNSAKAISSGADKAMTALEKSVVNSGKRIKIGLQNTSNALNNLDKTGEKAFQSLRVKAAQDSAAIYQSLRHPIKGTNEVSSAFKKMSDSVIGHNKKIANSFLNPMTRSKEFTGVFVKMSDSINKSMFGLLKTLGASDKQLALLTNTAVKDGEALTGIGQATAATNSELAAGATAAGGLGASLGALIPIAAGVAAVAGSIYYAWKSNFGNIQGVVKTAIDGIKGILAPLKPTFDQIGNSLSPIIDIIKKIAGAVGALAIGAIVASVIGLAGALRITADVLAALVNGIIAVGHAATGAFQKVTSFGKKGDEEFKKAGKSMDAAKSNLGDIGDAINDTKNTFVNAASQIGKSSNGAKDEVKGITVSIGEVSGAAKQMKKDFENSKTKLSDLINTDGVSDKTKGFLNDVSKTLDQYQKKVDKASSDYQKSVSAAGKKSGNERLKLLNEANAKLADATQKNNKDLLNITQDLDRQLQQKKFTDGTAMTADQVKILTDQNNKYKEKLMEQNQIYIDAQTARIKNGQKLNKTQQQATITTIQANYQSEAEQIQAGEQKIKDLKAQIDQAKDATTKAQLQQELDRTEQHNKDLLTKQQNFGQQMNLAIANGHKLTYQTWSQGLQQLGKVTDDQLQSMFLSFVSMNKNTGQQMQAFATLLKNGGTQGVDGLVQALSDGKFSAGEASKVMNDSAVKGLETLPNSMFKKGNAGKELFIKALKNGDFEAAGKYLVDKSVKGADSNSKKMSKSGKNNGKKHSKSLKGTAKDNENSGKTAAKGGVTGASKVGPEFTKAGKTNGKKLANGVRSQESQARSAGRALANAAKSGASGVSLHGVGANLARGLAAGIRDNQGSAVNAMRSLVNAVNNEAKRVAKIHSPSRLMRDEVGKYLATGVAEGIDSNAYTASESMKSLINGMVNKAKAHPLNFNVNGSLSRQPVHVTNSLELPDNKPQPAYINLNMGDNTFNAFIENITKQQNANLDLGKFM